MPVRQMKLRFDVKPTTRVVPSRLRPATPRGGVDAGNKQTSGKAATEPILGVPGLPPPPGPAEAPPATGGG